MSFLNPAVLFGLIATAIPIALHFLNLRKLKRIEFSTLSFLKELQKTKIRKIKLKQWLLLILRTLIIILLVLAFARPTVKNITMGGSSTAKTTAVVIIDNTFSMSVVTEKGSFLNHAKQIAKSLLNNFQEGDEIALIPLADVSNESLKPTTNFALVKKSIDNISVSDVSETLNSAMVKAAQIIYQSKNFNKEIYILTDLQKNRIYNSPKDLFSLAGMLNEKVRLYLFDMHDKQATNIGIDDLVSLNQIFEKDKTVGFAAKVKNYSDHPISNSVVSLSINGKKNAQQALNLAAGESKEISFETTLSDTGLVQVSADLEDDDILQDNKKSFSVYVPDRISLLLLYDNKDDVKFLKYALQDPAGKLRITESGLSQLSSINLKNYDAVFVVGSERNSNWPNLEQFINNGGKIVLMPGSSSTLNDFSTLCRAVGVPAPASVIGKQNSSQSFSQIDKIDFQNPVLSDLFENKNNQNIESPEIYFYFKLAAGAQGKSIISMLDNSSFLSEQKHGRGKIFLFNSAPVLSCNDFPMKGSFAPLMNKLLLSCASKMKENESYLAGQELSADISNRLLSQVKVIAPNGVSEIINTDSLPNKNYLAYSKTNTTGTYKFYSGDKLLDYFSVNHDPRESVTERASDGEYDDYLKQISFEGKSIKLKSDEDFSKAIYESRFGTELWKYFLIIVLLLAIAESIVARSSKKEVYPNPSQREGH
jgi:hypothetical protein